MPANSPELRGKIARAGAAKRWAKPEADHTRAELAVDRIEAYVNKIVADAPKFTEAQKARIAAILSGGAR